MVDPPNGKASGQAKPHNRSSYSCATPYRDADTELPHIYRHGIRESEVEEVLSGPGEDLPVHGIRE